MSVPKLRFKEFDGAWSETLFQDLFIFKNGVNASKEQYGSGIKFINVLDIINNPNGITYDSIIGSVNITSKEIDKNLVKYGDVLFQRSSETREEVGQSNVYLGKDPVVFGGFVIRGSAQKEYDPIFMNGLLKTDSLRDQITQLSGGSTRFNIGQDSLNKVSAYLPLKEEQTKIASFLSAVDEKISQLTQKHELLSQYKQGMMQKLFSQQIRFKADDGNEFGEWEELSLSKIFKLITDYVASGSFQSLRENVCPSDDGYAYYVRQVDLANGFKNATKFVDKASYDFLSKSNLFVGDILFTNIGASVGKVFILPELNKPATVAPNLILLRVNDYNNNLFIYQFLNSEYAQNAIQKIVGGTGMPKISKTDLKSLSFSLPSLEEQTKIANFLSAIDQKIEIVAQQIEQAKQWKKGLLQQMFV